MSPRSSHRHKENIIGPVSAGFFLVLIGVLFIITPSLFDQVVAFFQNLVAVDVPNTSIKLPAPANIGQHSTLFSAAYQFSLVWGAFAIVLLVLRFATHSPTNKKAENVSDIFFWFGNAYLIQTWLIGRTEWFEFWALWLILLGVSLVVRAAVLAVAAAVGK